jgi:hypothetical protein
MHVTRRRLRQDAPRLKFHALYFDGSPETDPDETGVRQLVHLFNTSAYVACDVEVLVMRDEQIVGQEYAPRIDPMPANAARIRPWVGCGFRLPYDEPTRYSFLNDLSLIVRFSDEARGSRWELRTRFDERASGLVRRIA